MDNTPQEIVEVKQGLPHMGFPTTAPQFLPYNYHNAVKEAWEKNELIYTCVQRITAAFVESPLVTFDKDGVRIDGSEAEELFQKPNPFQSYVEFMELSLVYYYLSGNLFWELVRDGNGRIVEIWVLRPDLVKIVPSKKNFIAGYQYDIGTDTVDLPIEDVVHFKWADGEDQLFGMAPIKPAFRQIDTDNEATDVTKVIFENSAFPFVVIKTQEELDAAKSKRLSARWMNKFGGKKRGKPAFLQQGMEVQTLEVKLNDLLFPDLRDITETRILGIMGVPPIIAGAKVGLENATYSNAPAFREFFFYQTINPLYTRFLSKLLSLSEELTAPGETLGYDTTKSSFLRQMLTDQQNQANKMVVGGWITINEGRKMIGLKADPLQKGYLRPMSSVFVPEDGSPGKLPVEPPSNSGDEPRAPRDNRLAGGPKTPKD